MSALHWLMLTVLSFIWGGTFLFAKVAVAEIPPLMLVFLRVVIGAATLHVALRLAGHRFPLKPSLILSFLVMGLLNNAVPFSLIFWGQTVLSASLASILNATTPIFTVIVAAALFRQEALSVRRIAGIAIGFGGVVVMLSPGLAGLGGDPVWAELACLGAALSYAFAAAFARRFRGVPTMVAAAGQLTGSSVLMLPLALWQAGDFSLAATSSVALANVAALGVLSTGIAYLLYFRLLTEAGATNASLVTLLIPLSATLMGAVVLGETLGPHEAAGLAVLLFGLLILDGRVLRFLPRRSTAR
ncbi:DMT family transporter [Stappia sp. F7233]|uniref:DMT family transporter n=1 Tax=Stappia albiluteola TaxID=2758565 RepID=A0A839AEB4_9HYPH|nr:DMT family transporter [Stappia albiluteola]MBA5777252.1 DMT family transporter [Stappia albiluteola]